MAAGETRDLRPEIERIKERKDGLDVLTDLLVAARGGGFHSLAPDDLQLAKWWGLYPQRPEEDGFLMLRIRVPNGAVTSEQLRAIGDLSVRFGRSTGDVTTRQCIQLHWLRIEDVPEIFATLDRIGLTSAQACGDVWRNVVGCPLAGVTADELFDSRAIVDELSTHFVGNRRFSNLPRKFKVSVCSCRHHCAQHEINDIGLVGVAHPELGLGYDVWVGGGLGASARMGRRLGVFASLDDVIEVADELTAIFRDNGNRQKRTRARSKFLVDEWGVERVRAELEHRIGRPLPDAPPPAAPLAPMRDHVGVTPQREPGRYALGGATLRGRLSGEQMIALAWVAEHFGNGRVRLTNRQNVLVLDVPDEHVEEASAEMAAAGAPVRASSFRRQTISCTGIEFCRLAVSETKEVAAGIIAHLEDRMGDLEPPVRINVNGCPNACAQYQIADIGLQGALARRGDEKVLGFQLHLGGRLGEERTFGKRTAKPVPAEDVRFVLERVLLAYRDERAADESFGRWVDRQVEGRLQELVGTQLDEGGIPGSTAYSDPATLPTVLVPPAWLEMRLDDPAVAIVEVSEDPTLYPSAHIVGARSIDPADLHGDDGRAPVLERLAELLSERGITPDHTIVLYGDRDNWFASYAFWLLRRLGHRDLRLLDGGRRRWIGEDRPVNADERAYGVVDYPVPGLALPGIRAQRGEVEAVLGEPGTVLLDVRTIEEYEGTTTHDPAFPREAAARAGHIPGAVHVPWEAAVREDGTVRPLVELRGVFEAAGVKPEKDVIVYCRIGERASHTWLVLQELLGYPKVRVYDGSWTEWAEHHDLPIAVPAAASDTTP